ncbi:Mitotic spindle checkpoint component mad2 [Lambiella insularis]|nr:Mitotic spindle checkpoint component mad2 [Lambiella insularis]
MSVEKDKSKVHKLSLKGSSKLVAEFFEYSINTILYQRGVYPAEDFTAVKKYGLNMLVSADDQVKAYIKKIMSQLNKWMLNGKISKLVVVITSKETGEHVERWQFDVHIFNKSTKKSTSQRPADKENAVPEDSEAAPEKTEKEIQGEIQSIFRQITASVTFLPQLDGNFTFNVLVYANADSDVPLEWGDSDAKEIKDGEKVQLRSFSTGNHKVDTLVSYRGVPLNPGGVRLAKTTTAQLGPPIRAMLSAVFRRNRIGLHGDYAITTTSIADTKLLDHALIFAVVMKPAIVLGRPIPYLKFALRYLLSSPKALGFGLFLFFYLVAITYCRLNYYRDPTSAFFSQARGYDKIYSLAREQQAAAFIDSANTLTEAHTPSAEPKLCLGVATVSRPDKQYIRSTIGSLLDGLSVAERRSVHFMLFIAHTDQHAHPIYGEKWVETLPDTLLTYDADEEHFGVIQKWEKEKDYISKGLYDYAYLLDNCYKTGAPYVAMVEGDVLAVEGWYPRAMSAAEKVEDDSWDEENSSNTLYIRMFYTEAYLGWNSEQWPRYLGWSFLLFLVTTVSLIAARASSPMLQQNLSNITLGIITLICLPACILLYFFAGAISMQPPAPGIHRMDNFGCCSQGFIFLRHMIPHVLDRIKHHTKPYIDMLMEAVADEEGLSRWVVVPSLLQHIGGQSSKGDAIADARAKMIWNFGFEMYNAATLSNNGTS